MIPRSREVGQSFVSSAWTTGKALRACVALVWQHRPDVLIANGPGTCLPMILAALLLRVRPFV